MSHEGHMNGQSGPLDDMAMVLMGLEQPDYQQNIALGFENSFTLFNDIDEGIGHGDFDLETIDLANMGRTSLTNRHSLPELTTSLGPNSFGHDLSPTLSPLFSRRADTFPLSEELVKSRYRQHMKNRIDQIESQVDERSRSHSPDALLQAPNEAATTAFNVNQILNDCSWPVPTFLLDPPETLSETHKSDSPRSSTVNPNAIDQPATPVIARTPDCLLDTETVAPSTYDYPQQGTGESLSFDRVNETASYYTGPISDSGVGTSTLGHHVPIGSQYAASSKAYTASRQSKSIYWQEGESASQIIPGKLAHLNSNRIRKTATFARPYAPHLPLSSAAAASAAHTDETNVQRQLSSTAVNTMKTKILEPILKDKALLEYHKLIQWAIDIIDQKRIGTLRDLEKFLIHKAKAMSDDEDTTKYNTFAITVLQNIRVSLSDIPAEDLMRPYDPSYDQAYFLDTFHLYTLNKSPDEDNVDNSNDGATLGQGISKVPTTQTQARSRPRESHRDDMEGLDTSPPCKRLHHNDDDLHPQKKLRTLNTKDTPHRVLGSVTQRDIASDDHAELERIFNTISYGFEALVADTNNNASPTPGKIVAVHLPPETEQKMELQMPSGAGSGRRAGKGRQKFSLQCKSCTHAPFERQCDLTKHEKTHTRPWKCEMDSECKYTKQGFPTQKERDRHHDDKHSQECKYHCHFPPCTYKSKRDSNCKQHMEKAHGYRYIRQRGATGNNNRSQGSPDISTPTVGDVQSSTQQADHTAQMTTSEILQNDLENRMQLCAYQVTQHIGMPQNTFVPCSPETPAGNYASMNAIPGGQVQHIKPSDLIKFYATDFTQGHNYHEQYPLHVQNSMDDPGYDIMQENVDPLLRDDGSHSAAQMRDMGNSWMGVD